MITRVSRNRAAQALAACLVLLLAAVRAAPAEESIDALPAAAAAEPVTLEGQAAQENSASAVVNVYILPDSRTYAQPTLAAEYKRVHLEARYNYEALDTGSAWIGYTFGLDGSLSLQFTPMLGGVFGHTAGVAPGYELTVGYWKLELYSEGEYLFDTDDSSDSFAYTWSELSLSPMEWLRFGVVGQRTRAYQTDVDIQRGLLIGFSYRWARFTTYVFDLDQSQQTIVLALGGSF